MPIKPYPEPQVNPKDASKPFSTRFATGFAPKPNDPAQEVEMLEPARFQRPVLDFVYKKGQFDWQPRVGADQKKLEVEESLTPYIPDHELQSLVRLMQIVKRPVLLKGEPGSGKTQLARSVAYEWYGRDFRQHYFEWHIKSHSKATDGLYTFDHLRRLRDVQMAKTDADRAATNNLEQYRELGPLGQAFLVSTAERPAIVLIDEIDKADLDFPNDLLLELDQMWFGIPETGETIRADHRPLIFITSNDERELPEAFLRRCLFMYTEFPKEAQLRQILQAHLPDLFTIQQHYADAALELLKGLDKDATEADFVQWAIRRFTKLRDDIRTDPADNKRVSTSELIDWLRACQVEMDDPTSPLTPANAVEKFNKLPLYFQTMLKTYRGYQRENTIKS